MSVVLVLMTGAWLVTPATSIAAERAPCIVCQVNEGKTEPEPVKAVRTHGGKTYSFCSEKCARAFDSDPEAYLPPTFPRPAPAFALATLEGDSLTNRSLEGKVVLLDFWATWCGPCRKSMAELQTVHDAYAERGVTVAGISIDEGPHGKVRQYVERKNITYPIAVDSDRSPAWGAFHVKTIPAAFLIDREGRIVAQWTGAPVQRGELEAKLAELLARE